MSIEVEQAFDNVILAANEYKAHPTAQYRAMLNRRLDQYQDFWIHAAAERNTTA